MLSESVVAMRDGLIGHGETPGAEPTPEDMLHAAEEALAGLGAPKVNLQVRSGNDEAVAFYRDLGYEIEERVSLGKRLGSA